MFTKGIEGKRTES